MLRAEISSLTPTELNLIHDTSMRILGEVGVKFMWDDAIHIFKKHGVKADGQIVYLEEDLVMKALSTVPSQFTITARNPEKNVTIGDFDPVFAPAYGAPFIVDPQIGRRKPSMEDYHNLVRLVDALPNQDLSGHLLVEPADVSPDTAYLRMIHASILHSDKPFIGNSARGKIGASHTMEMAKILFSEEVTLKGHPVTLAVINTHSPLGYGPEMAQALFEYARWGQPILIAPGVMAGATGPITLSGVIAQQNAEILAGITLAQLINPGTPVVYGSASTIMDMKSGTISIGCLELAEIVVAATQMARHYGLPCRGGGALTDANSLDAQAGFESMFSLLITMFCNVDLVLQASGILSSYLAVSYEKFVIDDEFCGVLRQFRRGITVTPETLAYDVIARVGPGGNFLMEPHTVERCHTEFWQPKTCYRKGLHVWQEGGRPNVVKLARQRWHELLANHEDPPLEKTTTRQLRAFMERHLS